jgi:hypothetical protein
MVKYYKGGEKPETGKKYRAFGGNALDISGIVYERGRIAVITLFGKLR